MSLTTTVPKDWKCVSNSIETRYDSTSDEARRVLENHDLEWLLDTYDSKDDVAVYEF